MPCSARHVLLLLLSVLFFVSPMQGESLRLDGGTVQWSLDAATLRLHAQSISAAEPFLVSAGIEATAPTVTAQSPTAASWSFPDHGLSFEAEIQGSGLQVRIVSSNPQHLFWPAVPLQVERDALLWPYGGGRFAPLSDEFWREELGRQEWDAIEALSLPVFGVVRGEETLSWLSTEATRNRLVFEEGREGGMRLVVAQEFSEKAPRMEVAYRFHLERGASPLAPALHYRAFLRESGEMKTLREKARERPGVDRLRGALHAYLWGGDGITRHDVRAGQWKALARGLLDTEGNAMAARLRGTFSEEQWAGVEEMAGAEWPNRYLQGQIAAGLSAALRAEEGAGVSGGELAEAFPGVFLPPERWGDGVSLKMLDALAEAGVTAAKLCVPGHEDVADRPWVAQDAEDRGWLMGAYDSYHSVHDPVTSGTAGTWSTAQMAPELYREGSIRRADGSFHKGFQGVGRKLNPVAGRAFVEERVRGNMAETRYNYYFLDCDATGEVYDDFSAGHPLSREEDVAARLGRLEWIGETFGVVVGSEGGHAFAGESIDVGEGVAGPFFGWDEPEMKDPESPYFRGRYWPPDGPDVFLKEIPLKERFLKRQYDASFHVPLYAAALHDSVVVAPHWNNGHFKYPEARVSVALLEVLHLTPPMYHFNVEEFALRKEAVREHLAVWAPLHREHGFGALTSFAFLTSDRFVQESRFGEECRIVANFGAAPFVADGVAIPPKSVLIYAPRVWGEPKLYTPSPATK